ncbi:MAG: polysaccharide deacetylase family protein [Burkholderiaceae bacterium]|nr:polysaccharide deacetylase family protein [Burkholderiaceae bacterium]
MSTYQRSAAPLPALMRAIGNSYSLWQAGQGRLCIVNYHRILEKHDPLVGNEPDVAVFREHMKMLADCFNVLPLHQAMQALQQRRMPPRAVCITFDDGYRSTYELALPVLQEFNLPATVFVTSGYVDNHESMWNDRIVEAVRSVSGDTLDMRDAGAGRYRLGSVAERCGAVHELTQQAKYLPPPERMALIERLESATGASTQPLMLSSDMVRALHHAGIEIGAHTVSHPILTSLSDQEALREMVESKTALEAITGAPVRYFAYPNGKAGLDFDQRHVMMARQAGFDAAFTTAPGPVTVSQDLYMVPRSRPWDATTFFYMLRLLRWLAG